MLANWQRTVLHFTLMNPSDATLYPTGIPISGI